MATQLMQLPCQQEEQHGSQTARSLSHGSFLGAQYAQGVAPRSSSSWAAASSPDLYDHTSIVNDLGSQQQPSHGRGRRSPTVPADGDASWEVRAFAEDSSSCSGQWPPRSYACSFCRREFRTAQALGGHMNVHRRERAQANNMAILRSTAQQAAAAAGTAPPATPGSQQPAATAAGGGGGAQSAAQWCLYSPMGVNSAAAAIDSPERRAFFYSSLAPGGAIIAMPSSSGGSSRTTSQYLKITGSSSEKGGEHNNDAAAAGGGFSSAPPIQSRQFAVASPVSSPISQGSRSSGSGSVVTSSQGGAYRSTSTGSGDSGSFTQQLQLGAFHPYQTCSPFAQEPTPLVTHELIQLRPQLHHHSTLFSKSMLFRGAADDVGRLDLELRLGPAC